MEIWELLRASSRRWLTVAVVAVVAAVVAVGVVRIQSDKVEVDATVYFAQALGIDTTSYSVDPTAEQLISILGLPAVQQRAASDARVPLSLVKSATITQTTGSPVVDVVVTGGDRAQVSAAAPALAAAGLEYYAEQSVTRAQSIQKSAQAALTSANSALAAFQARTGIADVDTAVTSAAAAVAAAGSGSASTVAQARLQQLQSLQPQYDALSNNVDSARTAAAGAYSSLSTAQSLVTAVALPGNVVTAPEAAVSRTSAYLRAAVGAIVVVGVLGAAWLALTESRRRRSLVASATDPAGAPPEAPDAPDPAERTGLSDAVTQHAVAPVTHAVVEPAPAMVTAEPTPASDPDPYLAQALRRVMAQQVTVPADPGLTAPAPQPEPDDAYPEFVQVEGQIELTLPSTDGEAAAPAVTGGSEPVGSTWSADRPETSGAIARSEPRQENPAAYWLLEDS
jgi:hypothetical protein